MELIPVNIVIGDRNYRIKIMPRDEEAVRKSVKLINDKIIEFKTQFAGKDMQDYIAMVLIWFATQQTQQTHQIIADEQVEMSLKGLEKIIDKILT
jgi:cell division protein ZapA